VKAWVLNVAGGGLFVELAAHSPTVNALARVAIGANFGLQEAVANESHPLAVVGQSILEAGDPLAYAASLVTTPRPLKGSATAARNILQFEVIYDELVPNEANEALARAAGFGFATPNVGSNSGIVDFRHLDANPGRVPLVNPTPDASGAFRGAQATSIVVQQSPAQHGENLTASHAKRSFGIPYSDWTAPDPFHHLDASFSVRCPYRSTQAAMVRFIDEAFQGKVPSVVVDTPPVRDLDDDGTPDETDPDPANPAVK
jgi:hypothetical protein